MPCPQSFLLLLAGLASAATAQVVITLENTDPSLHFDPDVCDASQGTPCSATWQIVSLQGASSGTVTTTTGPRDASLDVLPQLFLVLRGTSLTLRTSTLSTATANITLTAAASGTTLSVAFNTSAQELSAINLPPDEDVTFALTYVAPGRLDVDSITVRADNSSATSISPLPGPTTSAAPSFFTGVPTSTSTSSPVPNARLAQPVATIVGETLAGFFGLLLLALLAFGLLLLRRRNLRRPSRKSSHDRSGGTGGGIGGGGGGGGGHAGSASPDPEVMDVEMDDVSAGPRAI